MIGTHLNKAVVRSRRGINSINKNILSRIDPNYDTNHNMEILMKVI